jgi:CPA2 family monovalent cation:H+ antiporter-2
MLLSLSNVLAEWILVLLLTVAVIIGKAVIIFAVVSLIGFSRRVSAITALALAQIGEFSFIIALAGMSQGLLSQPEYQVFLGAAILSMMATPFLIKASPGFGSFIQNRSSSHRATRIQTAESGEETNQNNHVVIVGFGLNGQNLAKGLRRAGMSYLVVELNPEIIRAARQNGEIVIYGDATRREILRSSGLDDARVLVVAISDPIATQQIVGIARQLNSDLHIIVRTRYVAEVAELQKLGANDVIPEEFETGVEIFSRVLQDYKVEPREIQERVAEIRRECYEILRAPFALTTKRGND